MRIFDASSLIYAWDNYPIIQFPPLWNWLANQITSENIAVTTVNLNEVQDKYPECADWLKENNIRKIEISGQILGIAMEIKTALGIVDDNYHSKGVDENDLLCIAAAKVLGVDVVSNEERQNNLPVIPAKRKIPAVCDLHEASVTCIDFIQFIKSSGEIFN